MEPTILRFLAFLGAEVLFLVSALIVTLIFVFFIKESGEIKGRHLFGRGLSSAIVSMLFLPLILYILTGQAYISLFFNIFAISLVLTGLAELLWLIFGEPNVPWAEREFWHANEFNELFPFTVKSLHLVAILILISYTIYIGLGFFGEDFKSDQWPAIVLRATLVYVFSGFLVTQPASLYILMCRNIADATRSRIFINKLAQSIMFLIIVSVFVWSLDPDAPEVLVASDLIVFTPVVLYISLGYVAFLLVIPYLIGRFRHKAWTSKLNGDSSGITDGLLNRLRSPLLVTAVGGLVEAEREIEKNLDELAADKSYILIRDAASDSEAENPIIPIAAEKSVQRDPRFIHAKKLTELRQLIEDCEKALESETLDKEKRYLLKNFGEAIHQWTQGQIRDTAGRPLALGGITAIIVAIANYLINNLRGDLVSMFGP